MEFFSSKKTNEWSKIEAHIRLQQKTELDVLRTIKESFEQENLDAKSLVKAVRHFGFFPIHEDYTLDRMVREKREEAEKYGQEESGLWREYALLQSAQGIAMMKIGLQNPGLASEEKTLLKEAAQLQVFSGCSALEDREVDLIFEYIDAESQGIAGIDFSNQASIEAALESVDQ